MKQQRAWLIDASIYIFRAWFSMPDRWFTQDEQPVQAVYGYTKFLLDFIDMRGTDYFCAVAFDESLGSNYRNEIYPAYKSSRELPDDDLAFQLQACREVTERLGFACYGGPRYEADDYLAAIGKLCGDKSIPVTVVTRDKDLGQIIRTRDDHWWDFAQDITLDELSFAEKFGVKPQQFGDYLALVGDPIDDIPGVPGVGAKTAAALLQHFDDLNSLHANLAAVAELPIRGAAKLQVRLEEHWAQVEMARQLTGLPLEIPGIDTVPNFSLSERALQDTQQYLQELNLDGPLTRRCAKLAKGLESS